MIHGKNIKKIHFGVRERVDRSYRDVEKLTKFTYLNLNTIANHNSVAIFGNKIPYLETKFHIW